MFENLMNDEGMRTVLLATLIAAALITGIATGFFRVRKIQPKGFKWLTLRNEVVFAAINLTITALTLGPLTNYLKARGFIEVNPAPAAWSVVAAEYALYFVLFDTWFYWWHRLMHKRPFYGWVHKVHHRSTSPNLLTTVSETPMESLINGGFVPIFLSIVTVHEVTTALIFPTAILMGLYVHSGYEFLPRWWNRSWATKWFISATFHDQHHKFFNFNYGGYTTLWDRVCGTMRPRFENDFERLPPERASPAAGNVNPSPKLTGGSPASGNIAAL